jgi:hypothetical protein
MVPQQLLDPIPIPGVFLLMALLLLAVFEGGFRIGRWWQRKTPEDTEGPTGVLVGSLLALMGFLLAITMGMASDRYDARRALVLQETNAIGTAYLRAGYLPEEIGVPSRTLLREYAPLRVSTDDVPKFLAAVARSEEIHAELWALAEQVAREQGSDVVALYIESLNEVIDLHTSRVTAGVYARVPETVLMFLLLGSALTVAMVGYSAGLTERRSPLSAVVLIVVLAATLALVYDLDRPRSGFVNVSQQPLIDLTNDLGPP